ncbi:J domain-containing protein [Miltoncostaea marina]|uniref:J domain-containing protein n=1 Tax=Miltoncostaea marina TaxID=2843215 RepID=UPI001C3CB276|nr:J domain-containing protein [Miltoncostaea marina]
MADPFIIAAGPAPARGAEGRWRQVALLAASSALGDAPRAASALAATLLALDHPDAALSALERADAADPWARWWRVLAAGQSAGAEGLGVALASARELPAEGPDGREVRRRLADLHDELAALGGDAEAPARFAVLGHRARPARRMLIGGRSSAAFLVEPGWESLRLVRLAPSEGPALGNRAHLGLAELIGAVRRGESGPGWEVPADAPAAIDPERMLGALREDPAARDRRLIDLAREVAEERERLVAERALLAEERAVMEAERARRPRPRPQAAPGPARVDPVAVPRTSGQAAALLGVDDGAPAAEVERAYREQITRCHPDRVAGLHPAIRGQAEGLTVALNSARDLLLGRAPRRRAQRASG